MNKKQRAFLTFSLLLLALAAGVASWWFWGRQPPIPEGLI